MQEQVTKEHELFSTRLSQEEAQKIDELVEAGVFLNRADFLRQAAREKLSSIRVMKLRTVGKEQARQEVFSYLEEHGKAYASDIADALALDIDIVFSILHELKSVGKVE
jgi:Arc/MetJ-type ribon-helix-helix transcriptional regulator